MNMVVPEMSKYLCDESVLVKTSCFQSLIEILELFEDRMTYFFDNLLIVYYFKNSNRR